MTSISQHLAPAIGIAVIFQLEVDITVIGTDELEDIPCAAAACVERQLNAVSRSQCFSRVHRHEVRIVNPDQITRRNRLRTGPIREIQTLFILQRLHDDPETRIIRGRGNRLEFRVGNDGADLQRFYGDRSPHSGIDRRTKGRRIRSTTAHVGIRLHGNHIAGQYSPSRKAACIHQGFGLGFCLVTNSGAQRCIILRAHGKSTRNIEHNILDTCQRDSGRRCTNTGTQQGIDCVEEYVLRLIANRVKG